MKLVGWEQLAAQGVSGRQVYKGVAGDSQRRGSVASPVMIGRSRNAAGNHPLSAGRMTSGGRQLRADRSGSGDAPGRAQHTSLVWAVSLRKIGSPLLNFIIFPLYTVAIISK